MLILANAFSLQMLDLSRPCAVQVAPVSVDDVRTALTGGFVSAVGHQDTAAVLSDLLGTNVPCNRINVRLTQDDVLIVAQLTGGRLPDGATRLPDGFAFQFAKVTVQA